MAAFQKREAWNKGKLVGQKPPLKPRDTWAIRIHLRNTNAYRDLALFNLAIDSKLRGCGLVGLRLREITQEQKSAARAALVKPRLHVHAMLISRCNTAKLLQ